MRKIVFLMHVSLDGYVAGPNGEMDWIVYNDELESYVHALHSTVDAAIYGRVTFQMMESYWPRVLSDPSSTQPERNHAEWLDSATKIVISRTLNHSDWKKTIFIGENIAEEITKLKQQPGKNMWLLGSPSVAQTFMRLGLIDEYRLNVNPVILGSGLPLFGNLDNPINLKLLESKTITGGIAALRYEPVKS